MRRLVCVGLVLTAILATLGDGRAAADRCTGGTGMQRGAVPPALTAAVPALTATRWSGQRYPGFQLRDIDPVFVDGARLWGAFDGHAYWVVPAQRCAGDAYVVCALATSGTVLDAAACGTPDDISRGVAIAPEIRGERLGLGLAPPGTGRVTFTFDDGGAGLYAAGGVFAGSLDTLGHEGGPVRSVTYAPGEQQHYVGPLAVVDQTGHRARSAVVARALQRGGGLTGVDRRVVDLGPAIAGTRAHTVVLYQPGEHRLARRVARELHTRAPRRMAGGPRTLLGTVTSVAVLLGRDVRPAESR